MWKNTPPTTLTLMLRPWPMTFDLHLSTLNLDPHDLDLGAYFWYKVEKGNFYFFDLSDFDLWPWPLFSSEIWWSIMCVLNFRSLDPMDHCTAERKQTNTQTDTRMLPKILPLLLMWELRYLTPLVYTCKNISKWLLQVIFIPTSIQPHQNIICFPPI